MRADKNRYEHLWIELRINISPTDIHMTYPPLVIFYTITKCQTSINDTHIFLSQVNSDDNESRNNNTPTPGIDGDCNPIVICYKFNKTGHIRLMYPSSDSVQFFAISLTSLDNNIVPSRWTLLNSCSSIDSMCNKELINKIESVAKSTRVWTNSGYLDYDKTCNLNNINIKAYYNKDGIANILSMSEVSNFFRIVMDTSDSDFIKDTLIIIS